MLPITDSWKRRAQSAYRADGTPAWLTQNNEPIEGIYLGIPNVDYHAIDAISSTVIKDASKMSLSEVKKKHFGNQPFNQTPAMLKGELVHEACLEPELFENSRFRLVSKSDFPDALDQVKDLKALLKQNAEPISGSKAELIERIVGIGHEDKLLETQLIKAYRNGAGDEATDEVITRMNEGVYKSIDEGFSDPEIIAKCDKKPVPAKLYDEVIRCQVSVSQHEIAKQLLDYGEPEVSLIAFDEEENRFIKCRFDYLSYDGAGIDVKTASNVSPKGFKKAIRDYRYDIQQVHYTRVAELLNIDIVVFAFIGIDTTNCSDVVVYEINDLSMQKAFADYHKAYCALSDAMRTDVWPGYGDNNIINLTIWSA